MKIWSRQWFEERTFYHGQSCLRIIVSKIAIKSMLSWECEDKEPYWSFISMNMASKDYINFILNKPTLEHCSHALTLHEMCIITIVEWNMHQNNEPRCLFPVNILQFYSQPLPLRCVLHCQHKNHKLKRVTVSLLLLQSYNWKEVTCLRKEGKEKYTYQMANS